MADTRHPPFQPGNTVSVKHGHDSEARIKPVARTQKRRLLRQIGLAASDLDGIGRALLDNWARAQAKVELLDRWFEANGFLDPDGEPVPATKVYFTAVNSGPARADAAARAPRREGRLAACPRSRARAVASGLRPSSGCARSSEQARLRARHPHRPRAGGRSALGRGRRADFQWAGRQGRARSRVRAAVPLPHAIARRREDGRPRGACRSRSCSPSFLPVLACSALLPIVTRADCWSTRSRATRPARRTAGRARHRRVPGHGAEDEHRPGDARGRRARSLGTAPALPRGGRACAVGQRRPGRGGCGKRPRRPSRRSRARGWSC